MKKIYLLIVLSTLIFSQLALAQCPPPGFPQPGNTCPTAPILCANLDGYCATINNNNSQQNFPGCPGWQLNNDEWFAFFAGSTSITVQVTPSSCSQGGMQGLQGGIYAGCGPPWIAMDLQCSCTTSPFILSANNFVVGQIYYFVLDGCGGNVCNYEIDVLSGSTVGVPPANPGPVTGPATVCQGATSAYTLPPVTGATSYAWTVTPALGTTSSTTNTANINWTQAGTADVCVTTSNLCFSNATPSCFTVNVTPTPTATLSGSGVLCQGSSTPVPLTVTFTGTGPWEFSYTINGAAQPAIQTNSNPYTLNITTPGTVALVNVLSLNGNCAGTVSGTASVTQSTIDANAAVQAATCGQSNGNIDLSVNPPGTYTYAWSNSAATQDLMGVLPGTYTVTVTGPNGCTKEIMATVPDNQTPITLTGNVTANTTCNGGNGAIDLTISPSGTYDIDWSNSETTEDLTGLTPGTYSVTVTLGTNCTQTASFTVPDQPNEPQINSTTTPSTCDQANGDIDISVSGGVQPYTFQWSNNETTEDLSDVLAGSYSVTVTGANGCTAVAAITLTNNNPPISLNANVQPNTTCNGGNGSIDLTISPSGTYVIDWSNMANTEDLTGLLPGSYSVTVSAGGSCSQTASFTIPDQPNEPTISQSTTPSTCDEPNGDIDISVSGGVQPYTFQWSNNETTEDLSDVLAGSYSVTVTGANGCSATAAITLTNNNPPINISGTAQPNTDCTPGSGNGSVSISIAPSGMYTITWSNNATGQNLTDLPPGTYSVTVSAGGSCSQTASFTVPDQPLLPAFQPNVTPATCGLSNGSVSILTFGGEAPFSYVWSDNSTNPTLTGLAAGSYAVTVTGANGCSASTGISVPDNQVSFLIIPVVTPNTNCTGTPNGSISVTASPAGNYTYQWSNGQTGTTITNLSAGDYTVTVSAGGNCTQSPAFNIVDQPSLPTPSATVTPATCGLPNGSATVTASGGVPPFTFQWSNNTSGPAITNMLPGSYQVTVTGSNGCSAVDNVTITNDNIPIIITETIIPNTSCTAGNGSISLSVQPTNVTYLWSNNEIGSAINNLDPGNYTVTVSAGGTCTQIAGFTVPDASEVPFLSYDAIPTTCGSPNGAIDLFISGGQQPYSVVWSNGSLTEDISDIPADVYSVTVTTAVGCTAFTVINVPNNDVSFDLNGFATGNSSCASPNGSVQLNVSPGGSYTYFWNNFEITPYLIDVPAGTYTVTVSAGGTCTQVGSFQVFDFISYPTLSTVPTSASCGQNNGAVNLTVSNGTSPFSFNWSNMAATEDLNGVAGGAYTVTVTDGAGCSATASANVGSSNVPVNISGTPTANTSCLANNGAVNINVSPTGTYTFLWSNMAVTEDLASVASGTYTVTVSAGGNCTSTASFTVGDSTSDPMIAANITAAICGASNGAIDLSVTGATAPYGFSWSNMAASEDLSGIAPGDYTVTVSGANGCSSTATYNVANNSSSFSIAGTAQPLTSCGSNNGSVDLTITPSGSYVIQWSNMAATEDLSGLPPGTYTVTVTEAGSCSASASFTVVDETEAPTIAQAVTAELCGQADGAVDLTVSGSTAPYAFAWSNMAASEDLTDVPAGSYAVTVTGANGCSTTASATVPANTIAFSINGVTEANTSCGTNNGSVDVTISPSGTYDFVWSNMSASEDLTGLAGGSYTVTVTAVGNCVAEASFTVASTTLDPVISQSISPATCGESTGGINLTVSGGVGPFTFEWSNMATSEDLASVPPGTYSVEVVGSNGCATNATFNLPNNSILISLTGVPSDNTSCDTPNGSVGINVSPSGVYAFEWSNMESTEDIAGLPPGTYTVTVTQGLTCSAEASFSVGNDTNAPNFSPAVAASTCGGDNGGINLTVTGGTSPYSFAWSNMAVTEDLTGIPSGSYAVTVTGADGCANTGTISVPDDLVPIDLTGTPAANTACVGGNGSIDLTVSPVGTYTFVWSNMAVAEDLAALSGGSYQVTVSAGGTCTAVASFTVPSNPDLPSISGDVEASICGAPDGSIDLTVAGGQLPYGFEWSNMAATEDLNGIISGNYTVTVTASNGCSATDDFNVPNNSNTFSFTGSPTANTLCGSGNGSIDLTVTPAGVYTFVWSNMAATEDIAGLAPGMYSVTVSDGGSCTASADFTVANNAPTVGVTGAATDVLCFGENTGAIDLTPGGGVAPYSFDWSPAVPGSPEDPQALASGDYSVTVTDASGCTGEASFSVSQPNSATQLVCTQSGNVSLPGQTDGEGTVGISGGTAPYTVDWSPGGGQQSGVPAGNFAIANLGEGQYAVSVTDANGCPATCGFTISTDDCVTAIGAMQTAPLSICGPFCLTASYADQGQYLDTDDLLQFVLHSGNGNQVVGEIGRNSEPTFCFDAALMSYGTTYYISAVAGNDDGTGNVLLTDACSVVSLGTPISFRPLPEASANQPAPLTCLVAQVPLQGAATIAGSTFVWSTSGGSIVGNPDQANVQANAAGSYTLIVDANGCKDTVAVQVTDLSTQVVASIVSSPGEILDCVISQIELSASATGTASPSFVWLENGQQVGTGPNFVTTVGGDFQLVAFDAQTGCGDTTAIQISDNTDFPPLFTDTPGQLNCLDTIVTLSGGSSVNGVDFYWATISGADTTVIGQGESVMVDAIGTYFLIGTAPNGCQNGQAVTVTGDFATPNANAGADQVLDCVQTPVALSGSGSANVTFAWSANDPAIVIPDPSSPNLTVNTAGIYTLTVTSLGNFCTDSDDVAVFQYENVPQAALLVIPPDCFGEENGIIQLETDPVNGPYSFALDGQNYGSQNFFAPLAPGVYEVQVTDGQGCVWTTQVLVPEPQALVVNLGADIVVNLGESVTLQAQISVPVSQLDTLLWTPSELFSCPQMPCDVQEFAPTAQTAVGLTVVDTNGCTASDLVTLFVKKERKVYIPNSFSPDGNGINDRFMVFGGDDVVSIKRFLVFDRWGETVYEYFNFEPNNPAYGWDGSLRGELMNPAVYVWFAEIEFKDGSVELFEGDVTLVR